MKQQKTNFVKNEQLSNHYRSLGQALLAYEAEAPLLLRKISEKAMANLRVALSYIPDSILDFYLEDLLDLKVNDRDLFIHKPGLTLASFVAAIPILGLMLAMAIGFHLSTFDYSNAACVATVISISLPFAILWEWVPRTSNRRLFFARLIAQELSRRRGIKRQANWKSKKEPAEALLPSVG